MLCTSAVLATRMSFGTHGIKHCMIHAMTQSIAHCIANKDRDDAIQAGCQKRACPMRHAITQQCRYGKCAIPNPDLPSQDPLNTHKVQQTGLDIRLLAPHYLPGTHQELACKSACDVCLARGEGVGGLWGGGSRWSCKVHPTVQVLSFDVVRQHCYLLGKPIPEEPVE